MFTCPECLTSYATNSAAETCAEQHDLVIEED